MHQGDQRAQAQNQFHLMIRDLVTEGADAGQLRDDVADDELASYCLHALTAASGMASKAAVRRLVDVIMAGLHRDVSRVRPAERAGSGSSTVAVAADHRHTHHSSEASPS